MPPTRQSAYAPDGKVCALGAALRGRVRTRPGDCGPEWASGRQPCKGRRGGNKNAATSSGSPAISGTARRGRSAYSRRLQGASRRPASVRATSSANANWEPLGPFQVNSANYGLVTGRISSLALDPADTTANTLIAGTTGGGVWISQNAGTSSVSNLAFVPLTDQVSPLYGAEDSSISIGAVTVQPGGTGVLLAGTGDPNDALDSYYGAGLLRSTDGGNTWTLIPGTSDVSAGLATTDYGFLGEGFAGFSWSTKNPEVVVAAVSQAYEGELVDADLAGYSYAGLYYSNDSGASWHLATITDGAGQDVQGPTDAWAGIDGNAATAVVWNPKRNLFVAAVRFHGYYQSPDGITWTRMAAQPGSGLTTAMCPTATSMTGLTACPMIRGALAVNPTTGDTFAWTVNVNNQDQGLWQDACSLNSGACSNQSILFGKQWSTAALETNTWQGAITIANGDYNLALAAVPSGQDTLVLAGANDLWKCSLAMACQWRNTTNSTTCMSAKVGEYQHAIAWSAANPTQIFVGNDTCLRVSQSQLRRGTRHSDRPRQQRGARRECGRRSGTARAFLPETAAISVESGRAGGLGQNPESRVDADFPRAPIGPTDGFSRNGKGERDVIAENNGGGVPDPANKPPSLTTSPYSESGELSGEGVLCTCSLRSPCLASLQNMSL